MGPSTFKTLSALVAASVMIVESSATGLGTSIDSIHRVSARGHSKRALHTLEKRDAAPLAATVVRFGLTAEIGWLQKPWFNDPVTKSIQPCQTKMNPYIQMAECYANSRIQNNIYSTFLPMTPDDPHFNSEGGAYGNCYAFTCSPPAEALVKGPNPSVASFWWTTPDKYRAPVLPKQLPGTNGVPPPIVCPNNMRKQAPDEYVVMNGVREKRPSETTAGTCYSMSYYQGGGQSNLGYQSNQVPNFPGFWAAPKDPSGKQKLFCDGFNLGCAPMSYAQFNQYKEGACDVSKCKPYPLKENGYYYNTCQYDPKCKGGSPAQGKLGYAGQDTSPCGKDPNSSACINCYKAWKGTGPPAQCLSKITVPGLNGKLPSYGGGAGGVDGTGVVGGVGTGVGGGSGAGGAGVGGAGIGGAAVGGSTGAKGSGSGAGGSNGGKGAGSGIAGGQEIPPGQSSGSGHHGHQGKGSGHHHKREGHHKGQDDYHSDISARSQGDCDERDGKVPTSENTDHADI